MRRLQWKEWQWRRCYPSTKPIQVHKVTVPPDGPVEISWAGSPETVLAFGDNLGVCNLDTESRRGGVPILVPERTHYRTELRRQAGRRSLGGALGSGLTDAGHDVLIDNPIAAPRNLCSALDSRNEPPRSSLRWPKR
jgi:hypothetical protein